LSVNRGCIASSPRRSVAGIAEKASGAFQIENPDKMADAKATALAGVESVLKTYQAILQQKPDAKAKALDDLLKKQSQGKLKDSVQKQCQ